jgi:hypothetical protein
MHGKSPGILKSEFRGKPTCLMKSPTQSNSHICSLIGQARMDPLQPISLISHILPEQKPPKNTATLQIPRWSNETSNGPESGRDKIFFVLKIVPAPEFINIRLCSGPRVIT